MYRQKATILLHQIENAGYDKGYVPESDQFIYKVIEIRNTFEVNVGDHLEKHQVERLMRQGIDVSIKQPKS
jgi:hypothetical protein